MQTEAAKPVPNIALRLARWAAERPLSPALIDGTRTISFGALDDECARLGAGLQSSGVRAGTRVVLMVPPSVELYALAFALFRIGAVPVFVDPGVGWAHLKDCLGQAEPEAFIGSPKAHLGRLLGRWARASLKTLVVARGFFPGATGLGALRRGAGSLRAPERTKPGQTAAILFTSGSTGAPKGAVYTHEMFDAQVEALGELFATEPGEFSVPTFPLFGLFDVALGMTAVLPRMDATRPGSVDPEAILEPIARFGAAQLFGSPALIDRVGRYAQERGLKLPTLKRALSAGAPVPAKTLSRFASLLEPGAQVHTPYGATEALPVAAIASAELEATAALTAQGRGVCVGKPVRGISAFVIPISDAAVPAWSDDLPLPPGAVGEIVVKGAVVSARYYGRPEATALAKIDGAQGAVYHRMGDLGYFDEQGRLWYCGRKSQRVETPSGVLYTDCCEGVFNAHPAVRRAALVGVGAPGAAVPVVCVELEDERVERDRLRARLLELGQAHDASRGVRTILFSPRFPVDARHNAKIQRERLAVWAAERLS